MQDTKGAQDRLLSYKACLITVLTPYVLIPGSCLKFFRASATKSGPSYLKSVICELTSLVSLWVSVCLPMQGTWVRSLVWEDPTCHKQQSLCAAAIEPTSYNHQAHTLHLSAGAESLRSAEREATSTRSLRTRPHSLQLTKAHAKQQRPSPAKDKYQ